MVHFLYLAVTDICMSVKDSNQHVNNGKKDKTNVYMIVSNVYTLVKVVYLHVKDSYSKGCFQNKIRAKQVNGDYLSISAYLNNLLK